MPIYKDSIAGARTFLFDSSDLLGIDNAEISADLFVPSVWKARTPEWEAIIYLRDEDFEVYHRKEV